MEKKTLKKSPEKGELKLELLTRIALALEKGNELAETQNEILEDSLGNSDNLEEEVVEEESEEEEEEEEDD